MPGEDQDILRVYLQKVMELSDARSSGPTEAELRTIAREVGISEEVLTAAARNARDHHTRGLGFLDHQRYDDAVTELSEAAALAPGRFDIQHALAKAYAGRYRQQRRQKDRQRAESLARRCLELDPDHQASFEILNALDPQGSSTSAQGLGQTVKFAAALVGLLALGGGLLFVQNPQSPPSNPPTVGTTSQESVTPTAPEMPGSSLSPVSDLPSSSDDSGTTELDIPIELNTQSRPELNLGFDLRLSRLNNYTTGRSFYTLNAVVANQGNTELEKVTARLELLGSENQILKEHDFDLLSDSAPLLRPGDQQAVQQLVEVVPGLSRAELVVVRVEQTPAAEDYGVADPVELHWPESRPTGMVLAARERSRRYSEHRFSKEGGGFFDVVLEIENGGSRPIRALKLKATILGADNAWTTEIERFVVTQRGPDLRAEGTRRVRFLGKVQDRPAEYRVSVIGIE